MSPKLTDESRLAQSQFFGGSFCSLVRGKWRIVHLLNFRFLTRLCQLYQVLERKSPVRDSRLELLYLGARYWTVTVKMLTPKCTKLNNDQNCRILSFILCQALTIHYLSLFPKQRSEVGNNTNPILQTNGGFKRLSNLDFWFGTYSNRFLLRSTLNIKNNEVMCSTYN